MTRPRVEALIVVAAIAVFALYKLTHLEFRLGDENVYFYMSDAILRGLVPYRDFFIADPPFFIYALAGWKLLIGEKLILFKVWPVLFDSLSAILIYLILRQRQIFFAVLGPIFYLLSFTVLSTSDYVTGAEFTIFLMLMAIYLDMREKPFWSGASWALSCLSKLYAGPALIGFMLYKLYRKEFAQLSRVIVGGLSATALVLLPFAISAPRELWHHLITHQLNRPAGISKWHVLSFFLKTEWLLIFLGTIGAFISSKKSHLFPLLLSALFFVVYPDLYYLYLHILMPFLVIGLAELLSRAWEADKDIASASIAICLCVSLYPVFSYVSSFAPEGVLNDPQEIALALEQAPEKLPIYGPQEVAPLVALMSHKEIFMNVIDTNTQNFASGTHDKEAISRSAIENGIYLVTLGEPHLHFDNLLFKKHCSLYRSFPSGIGIYKCYKSSS